MGRFAQDRNAGGVAKRRHIEGFASREETKGRTISEFQDRIVNQSYETAGIYSRNGTLILRKDGEKQSVFFTNEEIAKMEGATLVHNHPGSTTFSWDDISFMQKAKLDEIRVVSKLYEYRLLRNPSVTLSEFQISTAYKNAQMQILRMGGDPYKSDGLNEIMEIFAHNMGMTYMRDAR